MSGAAQPRGVSGERRNQAVVDWVATQLEDERAHLGLRALGELSDRAEGLRDTSRGLRRPAPATSARCGCAAPSRTAPGRPSRADHEQSGAAPPRPARPRVRRASARSLDDRSRSRDHGAQEQRRQRSDGDVELRAERPVVDRLLGERADVVGRYPDRHSRGDRDGERRPGGPNRNAAQISAGKTM